MAFRDKLLKLMAQRHIGNNKLSTYSGVASSTISYITEGKRNPKPSTLKKLAKGLNVSYASMLKMAGLAPKSQAVKHPEDYTNGHFDIAKALKNGHYMTWQGKPLTGRDKKILELYFGGDESKHE